MSEADKHTPSDMDEVAYLELIKESASTGKSIQMILAERHGHKLPDKRDKMADEVRKCLAENTFKLKPNIEQSNE